MFKVELFQSPVELVLGVLIVNFKEKTFEVKPDGGMCTDAK